MINSVFKYPDLKSPISIEFEFISFFNPQTLIEYTQKQHIPIEYRIQPIPASNRNNWMRFPTSYLTITSEQEESLKQKSPLYALHCHRVASPLLRTNEDILDVQKLIKCYNNCGDILIDNNVKFYFRIHKATNVKVSTVIRNIEIALYKLYKSTLEVIIHPTNIQVIGIDGLESWYELRNTLFLLHDMAHHIDIDNLNQFDLANCTKSTILQDFITYKIAQ